MTRGDVQQRQQGELKVLQMEYYYRTPRCPTSQIQKKTSSTSFAAHSGAMSLHPPLCRTQSFLTKRSPPLTCTSLYELCLYKYVQMHYQENQVTLHYLVSFADLKWDISLHITTIQTILQFRTVKAIALKSPKRLWWQAIQI